MINLIDPPGHVDLISETTTALRVTDGALVLVDAVDGVCMQTEVVLRQALREYVKPVCVINKVDRAILELKADKEALYQTFNLAIEKVNIIISTYHDNVLGDAQVYPEKGTVAFASGLQGWAFTLGQFASRYAKKFGVDNDKMKAKLWGDNFFNPSTRRWTISATDAEGKPLERAFNMFILGPLYRIFDAVMNSKRDLIDLILEKLEVKLSKDEHDLEGRPLLKTILHHFLPANEAILEMVVVNLPSPVVAQPYRVESLYEGPMDDESAVAIRNCNAEGPLVVYISKIVPTSEKDHFYALGRVFSGTVKHGMRIRIQGPKYLPGKKQDLFVDSIQRSVLMMGHSVKSIESCPAGNLVGLTGIDQFLLKNGTLTTSNTAYNMKVMNFSVPPAVQCAVEIKKTSELPKLVEALKRLSKSDPVTEAHVLDSGEHVVAATSEFHLEIFVNVRSLCITLLLECLYLEGPSRPPRWRSPHGFRPLR